MLTIPVGDLMMSYPGDSKKFSFSGPIYDGYIDDIRFLEPLEFQIELITIENGIEVVFQSLRTKVEYEGRRHKINISQFERSFRTHVDPLTDGDDIRPINNSQIDLAPVIREEIIMECMSV